MTTELGIGGPAPVAASVRSVTRALRILATFDDEHAVLSLPELLDRSGLPKTTAHRLIQTLLRNGFLFRRADDRYCLGSALLRLSRAVDVAWRLPSAADAAMESLRARSQETVNLYVLEGLARVCVAQKEGSQNVRYVIPVGVRLPLYAGASGKLLLAHQPPAVFQAVMVAAGRNDEFGTALAADLEKIRRRGYATSWDERERGASSVAAGIEDRNGRVIAALAVSGPTSRFTTDRVEEIAGMVGEASAAMADALAGSRDGLGSGLPPSADDSSP
jgi:DNA-binding IclR family transcriptional regulator